MNLLDWFKYLAQGKGTAAQPSPPPPELGAVKDDAIVQGLDFSAAIEAHRKWKARLIDFIEGRSQEKLDPAVICQDDKCALGRWIYGEGKTFCGHLPKFHQLKAEHAEFHIHAAEVVQLVQKGHLDEARQSVLEGPFAQYSMKTQTLLAKLYMEMKS